MGENVKGIERARAEDLVSLGRNGRADSEVAEFRQFLDDRDWRTGPGDPSHRPSWTCDAGNRTRPRRSGT